VLMCVGHGNGRMGPEKVKCQLLLDREVNEVIPESIDHDLSS
jgi:hypothetical protein